MKANPLGTLSVAALLAMTAACATPPPPPVAAVAPRAPAHVPPPAPPPRPVADWRDMPATPGEWRWAMEGSRSAARFGLPGQPALASLVCDKAAGQVLLGRSGTAQGQVAMAVSTTSGSRPLRSASRTGEPVAVLQPGDAALDAIAFSRGRFTLEVQGFPTLYLPSWPELSRVIEDCR